MIRDRKTERIKIADGKSAFHRKQKSVSKRNAGMFSKETEEFFKRDAGIPSKKTEKWFEKGCGNDSERNRRVLKNESVF